MFGLGYLQIFSKRLTFPLVFFILLDVDYATFIYDDICGSSEIYLTYKRGYNEKDVIVYF